MTDKNGKTIEVNDFVIYDERYFGTVVSCFYDYFCVEFDKVGDIESESWDFYVGDLPYIEKLSYEDAVLWKLAR